MYAEQDGESAKYARQQTEHGFEQIKHENMYNERYSVSESHILISCRLRPPVFGTLYIQIILLSHE